MDARLRPGGWIRTPARAQHAGRSLASAGAIGFSGGRNCDCSLRFGRGWFSLWRRRCKRRTYLFLEDAHLQAIPDLLEVFKFALAVEIHSIVSGSFPLSLSHFNKFSIEFFKARFELRCFRFQPFEHAKPPVTDLPVDRFEDAHIAHNFGVILGMRFNQRCELLFDLSLACLENAELHVRRCD